MMDARDPWSWNQIVNRVAELVESGPSMLAELGCSIWGNANDCGIGPPSTIDPSPRGPLLLGAALLLCQRGHRLASVAAVRDAESCLALRASSSNWNRVPTSLGAAAPASITACFRALAGAVLGAVGHAARRPPARRLVAPFSRPLLASRCIWVDHRSGRLRLEQRLVLRERRRRGHRQQI
jgi:hypothetical protein